MFERCWEKGGGAVRVMMCRAKHGAAALNDITTDDGLLG